MRPKSISLDQEKQMIQLYLSGKKIKEIMTITGIRSEQTIYRLLDENNIPRRPKIESKKVSFTATKEVLSILQDKEDISMFINNAIMAFN